MFLGPHTSKATTIGRRWQWKRPGSHPASGASSGTGGLSARAVVSFDLKWFPLFLERLLIDEFVSLQVENQKCLIYLDLKARWNQFELA